MLMHKSKKYAYLDHKSPYEILQATSDDIKRRYFAAQAAKEECPEYVVSIQSRVIK